MVEATLSSTFGKGKKSQDDDQETKNVVAMFQDAITVNIPIDVTVDLGVALQRTRQKRIEAIYRAFPDLVPQKEDESMQNQDEEEEGEDEEEEEEEEDGEAESDGEMEGEGGPPKKKKKKEEKTPHRKKKANGHTPQRHDFGSIVDYLEAKYVRGVVIQNEKEIRSGKDDEQGGDDQVGKVEEEENDEGQGSVYSESSFLDDRDLQRDVAEQVLAQSTTTKLELEGDDDFFVNVGDLDVEETELTQENYDPLDDSQKSKPSPRKRKKPSSTDGAADNKSSPATPPSKKKAIKKKPQDEKETTKANDDSSIKKKSAPPIVKKKVKVVVSTKKPKLKVEEENVDENSDKDSESSDDPAAGKNLKDPKKDSEEVKALKAIADRHRAVMERRFQVVKQMIKELTKEQLPRRPPLKSKVSITCPANKKEGDEVTFANPHIPGQRLRVQVPKGTFPGETFKVTVPVPQPAAGDDDEGVDHNKFPRDLQDELDMYAREYDVFCKHEGDYRHSLDEEYPIHLEKRKKYDQVVKELPKNLMTPVDSEYMKKLVRRARQNKSKRSKSAAVRRQSGDTGSAAASPTPAMHADRVPSSPQDPASQGTWDNEQDVADQSDAEEEEPPAPEPPTHRTIDIPERGHAFPEKQFSTMDFFQSSSAGSGGAP